MAANDTTASELVTGVTSVPVPGTPVPLSTDTDDLAWVEIQANSGNTDGVVVGGADVDIAAGPKGLVLSSGSTQTIRFDVDQLAKVYVDAAIADEGVTWVAGRP